MKYDYEHMTPPEVEDLYDSLFPDDDTVLGCPFGPRYSEEEFTQLMIDCIERGVPIKDSPLYKEVKVSYAPVPEGIVL